jgi:hypothetical protein
VPVVPAVEFLVPVLVLAGRERAASLLALTALLAFTVAAVRIAVLEGSSIPCGCFGRARADVRAVFARNVLLALFAVMAWAGAFPDPALRPPTGSELLPAGLAAGAVLVAAATLWRASVWLQRGRR